MIHRNTYINGPTVLRETWQTRMRDDLFFAGQISGVEGLRRVGGVGSDGRPERRSFVQRRAIAYRRGRRRSAHWRYYVSHADPRHYQPTNITFGIMPPIADGTLRRGRAEDGRRLSRKEARKLAHSSRALADLEVWLADRSCWDDVGNRSGGQSAAPAARARREGGVPGARLLRSWVQVAERAQRGWGPASTQ